MSSPVGNNQADLSFSKDFIEINEDRSWTGRVVKWLHTTPAGHLTQGIGGVLGAAACAMAAAAVLITAFKGIILGAILVSSLALLPLGIVVIAGSYGLATTHNYPVKGMHNCWDFAMDQFAQMKAQSLS